MKHAIVVVACLAVAAAFGCSRGEDHYIQGQVDLTGAPPQEAYVGLNCASCHGAELEGQRTAPALKGLAERDPQAVQAANPRLAYMAERYPIVMPAYAHTDEQVLRGLVSWLLAQ